LSSAKRNLAGKGQLIKPRDLAQLKAVAKKLPGTAIVIAVLRDHFLPTEKRLLKTFVRWCRRVDSDGEPTNPVLLLTSHELLFDHHISETWKSLGDPHLKFSNYETIRTAERFCGRHAANLSRPTILLCGETRPMGAQNAEEAQRNSRQ
jgi:hypothetical protein